METLIGISPMSLLGLGITLIVCYIFMKKRNPLNDIPGPRAYPFFGNTIQLDPSKPHWTITQMAKQYGGIFKLWFFNIPVVIVNDPASIHAVLVSQSAAFAGRPQTFRLSNFQTGVIFKDDSPAHKGRRAAMHAYLKQFGAGIKKIEEVTQVATSDLINTITMSNGQAIDMTDMLVRCVTDVTAILLIGEAVSDAALEEVKSMIDAELHVLSPHMSGIILDMFPFTRYFGNKAFASIQQGRQTQQRFISEWLDAKPQHGFVHHIQAMSADEQKQRFLDSPTSQIRNVFEFLGAGVITTSTTLSCLVNVLCQYPEVQEKLRQEMMDIIGSSRQPTMDDKNNMPYAQATLLEIGRYASIVPLGLPHKAVQTCTLEGYSIPQGTEVWFNLWALHHDEELWDEPFKFNPDRFLDSDGQLVPADHPSRRHLMPFSAGKRVCVGEIFARSRMFLILTRIVQNFVILPETTVENQPSCHPLDMRMGTVIRPLPYKVRMKLLGDDDVSAYQ